MPVCEQSCQELVYYLVLPDDDSADFCFYFIAGFSQLSYFLGISCRRRFIVGDFRVLDVV